VCGLFSTGFNVIPANSHCRTLGYTRLIPYIIDRKMKAGDVRKVAQQ